MHPSPRLTRTEARSSLGFGARVWRQLWRPRDGGVGGRTLVRGRDVPGVWARWDVGQRTRRHLAQVTLVFATHCSSLLRAGGAGCLETRLLVGAAGEFGFLNSLSRFGRGDKEKVAGTLNAATPSLAARAGCFLSLECSGEFPGKPLSAAWTRETAALGALCQVLFVPGITALDYLPTPSFPVPPRVLLFLYQLRISAGLAP